MSDLANRIANLSPAQLAQLTQQLQQRHTQARSNPSHPAQPALVRQPRPAGPLPLSFAQQRFWFLYQLQPDSSAYHLPAALELTGPLNLDVLECSLTQLIERHEVLRTCVTPMETGEPHQVILPPQPWNVAVVDVQNVPLEHQATTIHQWAIAHAKQPFNLLTDLPLRTTLLRFSPTHHVLLICFHHIALDGWSLALFVEELTVLYEALSAGKVPALPSLPIQYADFSQWQRQWLQDGHLDAQLAYWQRQLAGPLPVLQLPTDFPHAPVRTFQGRTQTWTLPDVLPALKRLNQQAGTTLFMTLLATFQVLLHRYSGQTDILVGSPIANRNCPETQRLMGVLLNTLVLRTDLSGDPSFREVLQRVKSVTLDAYTHQDLPFETLVETLRPERSLHHNPLFQTWFSLNAPPITSRSLADLTLSPIDIDRETAQFDLSLEIQDLGDRLVGRVEYRTERFTADTITRFQGHFATLLAAIAANPDQRMSELPLLTLAEQQGFATWNQTASEYPQHSCLHHLIEAQAERLPNAVAVVFGDRQLTYQQLNTQANQLAHHLQTLGVGPDRLVGISVEPSLEMVVGLIAILKAGGAYVPLDPAYPSERLAWMMQDAQVAVLLTQQRLISHLPAHDRTVCLDEEPSPFNVYSSANPASAVTSHHLAYVIYTSGSTGKPKGTLISHRGVVNYLTWCIQAYAVDQGEGTVVHSSLSFDLTVTSLFSPLLVGRSVELLPASLGIDSLADALNRRTGLSLVKLTPAQLQLLAERSPANMADRVRAFIIGGEALLPQQIAEWQAIAPTIRLVNEYGPTETVVGCCTYTVSGDAAEADTIPIGRPIANTQLYVLDVHGHPCPIGVAGALYIGGVGVARGYLNRPALTAETFVPNPFSTTPGDRLYQTGDWVRHLGNGELEYLGRIDHQVKIRGYRIEPGEVEAVLVQHPDVQSGVVVPQRIASEAEEPAGSGGLAMQRLVAYAVPHSGRSLNMGDLRQFLEQRLPAYMVPTAFVQLEALPLTPNGKVDRQALPLPGRSPHAAPPTAPTTPMEAQLAQLWSQVLRLEHIGIHDNFFELGGDSLLATQLVSRIRTALQIELPLRQLFEQPTIAQLARAIAAQPTVAALPAIERRPRPPQVPLSFAQQRLWFLEQLLPGAVYTLPATLRVDGVLHLNVLQQSLAEVVRRHEILRTTFPLVDGNPVQAIAPQLEVTIPLIDLRGLPLAQQAAERQRHIAAATQRSFDLAQLPLFHISVVQTDAEQILVVNLHHIIADGWSIDLLLRELATLYHAQLADSVLDSGAGHVSDQVSNAGSDHVSGQPAPLPPLPIQYADFALWQRHALQQATVATQLAYWQTQLAEPLPVLNLPTDFPRPAVQRFQGEGRSHCLPHSLVHALKTYSQQSGTTLFMVLLAAFKVLLYRYTGQTDLLVGTPIASRNQTELEGLIGCFVNTLALRTDLSGNPTFGELLQRVRDVTLTAYAHQDVPFEAIIDALQLDRNLSHAPLVQVMFVLQVPTDWNVPELNLTPLPLPRRTAKFDLTLDISETDQGLEMEMEYSTDLWDGATIERMLCHLHTLLEGIVAPQALSHPIDRLPLLTSFEQQHLLTLGVPKAVPLLPNPPQCIHDWFAAQAAQTPDAIALTEADQHLTYRELDQRSNQLAHDLHRQGIGVESRVGLYVERSLTTIMAILGILKSGAAYVPLDPASPPERLAFILADANISLLLTQSDLIDSLSLAIPAMCLDTAMQEANAANAAPLHLPVRPDNLAYIIYTSGSTGQPKGVAIPHRNVTRLLTTTQPWFNFNHEDVWTWFHSHAFDFSVWEIWGALLYGGRLVVVPYELSRSPAAFYTLLIQQKVTVLNQTPSAFRQLMQAESLADDSSLPLRLRWVIFGGEALEFQSLQPWLERHGNTPQLVNMYGITETTVHVTYCPVTDRPITDSTVTDRPITDFTATDRPTPSSQPSLPSLIGQPIPDLQLYLLDAQLQPVPLGVPGEIYVGGEGLARGYFNHPALTAERFVPHPYSDRPGARLYRTGDLARYRADGALEYEGRADQQVKLRGFRIELGEIESTLSQHPQVQDAVVLLREDEPGQKRLVAYVVCPEGESAVDPSANSAVESNADSTVNSAVDTEMDVKIDKRTDDKIDGEIAPADLAVLNDLRRWTQDRLPSYMLPASFVRLEKLPLTANGKVDRRRLPPPPLDRLETSYTPARTAVEHMLATIWQDVLGMETVGIHDNFFELGGDSILSIQVIARANQAGLQFTPKQLFQHQTIAELALVVDTAPRAIAPQGLVTGTLPLTPIQHWFFDQPLVDRHHWNQSLLLEVPPELTLPRLEQMTQQILEHHDALRLRFQLGEAGWHQWHADMEEATPCQHIDLSALPEERQSAAIASLLLALQASLHLTAGPLLRLVLIHRGGDRPNQLLWVIHHLVVDGVSWRILLEDFQALVQQLLQQLQSPQSSSPAAPLRLPAKTTAFKTWAERLQTEAASHPLRDELQAELETWLALQQPAPPLPMDNPTGENTVAAIATVTTLLDSAATQALLQEIPAVYRTQVNDLLLTALAHTFANWTGSSTLRLDLEGHGRTDRFDGMDLSRTVGWFTSLFPVWLNLDPVCHWGDAIQSVKQQLRQIPHQGVGFGLLRYLSSAGAPLRSLPPAQVSFNYLGQLDLTVSDSIPASIRLRLAPEGLSATQTRVVQGARNPRPYVLDVSGLVLAGQLHMTWAYSTAIHHQATIERLAQDYLAALRSLIAHCQSTPVAAYQPSDFPDVQLSQEQLDSIFAELKLG
ncbi:amino acid adenylation domain-containing protein [Leptolyngbya sp. AN02str]|uniref:amino acid adenylation domain-containing protein n=1 Tax=Leptolyngbya sp. AN02str TaxID=3423363 RepID=UPI003D310001